MELMNGFFLSITGQLMDQDAAKQVIACNRITKVYGLQLSENEAMELVETRNTALSELGRIEFGGGILPKLLLIFRNSPYLYKQNYTQTLNNLVEIFYYFKNEFLDRISDDELLLCMKDCFDKRCEGSVELLQGREMERLARHIRFGMDYDDRDESFYHEIGEEPDEEEEEND